MERLQNAPQCGKLTVKDGWVTCPSCKRNHRLLRVGPETVARELPVYCRTCRREIVLNIDRGQRLKVQSP